MNLVPTDDGGYMGTGQVITTTYRALQIERFDSVGDTLWTKKYFIPGYAFYNGAGMGLIKTQDQNYAQSGTLINASTNNGNGILIKFNQNGDTLWMRQYDGGGYWNDLDQVLQLADGSYILAGATNKYSAGNNIDAYLIKTDSNGNLLWEKHYGGG